MKKLFPLLCVAVLFLWAGNQWALAQVLVSTGMVRGMDAKAGTLTVMSDQTHQPLVFANMENANVMSADGKPAMVSDLKVGTMVTLEYAERGKLLYVSKIMFGDVQNTPGTAAAASTAVPPTVKPVSGNPNPSGYPDPKPAHITPLNTTNK